MVSTSRFLILLAVYSTNLYRYIFATIFIVFFLSRKTKNWIWILFTFYLFFWTSYYSLVKFCKFMLIKDYYFLEFYLISLRPGYLLDFK